MRGVVAAKLSDPDLQPLVLQLGGISAVTEAQPCTIPSLPVQQVKVTDQVRVRAIDAIRAAHATGARRFAPDRIAATIVTRDGAVVQRGVGEFRGAVRLADATTRYAVQALKVSLAPRDRDTKALAKDVQVDVAGGSPDASRRTDRRPNGCASCRGPPRRSPFATCAACAFSPVPTRPSYGCGPAAG